MHTVFAEERLSAGRLQESLAALQDEVRRDPSDAKKRIFLFQLLAIFGEWERSINQLDACVNLDSACSEMAAIYRSALLAERARQAVFAGRTTPTIFAEPQAWIADLVHALRLDVEGDIKQARELRLEAFDAAPTTAGELNGEELEWIGDADNRLGPVLEAVVNGQYMWVPFDRIKSIRIEAPSDLRDLVWLPAMFTWANGGEIAGLIPARYPGSETNANEEIRLARRTEWQTLGDEQFMGLGQRMLATDIGEYPLLEVRRIELRTVDA